jgi:hypothetical protein
LFALALWALSHLFGTSVHAANTGRGEGERAFALGTQAFEDGDAQAALGHMRAAYAADPDYRTAAGLGQVELHLERFRDAAEHLEYSLRNYPAHGDPEGKDLLMSGFAEARSRVVTLTLEAQTLGATFRVDGRVVATLPVPHDLFVEPGEHRFTVEKAGFKTIERERYAVAGGQQTLRAELEPLRSTAPGGDPARVPSFSTAERLNRSSVAPLVLVSGGILTLVAAGTGTAFHLWSQSTADDASELRARLRADGAGCDRGDAAPGCRNLEATLQRRADRQTIATVGFLGAATAALITTGIYTALVASETSAASPREQSAVAWAPLLGWGDAGGAVVPEGAIVRVTGAF